MGSTQARRQWAAALLGAALLWGTRCGGWAFADGRIIYVDADAAPGGNGSSWAAAFRQLEPALAEAVAGDEIWVAAGTYKPHQGSDREASFGLPNGVALYGGFRGDETSREQRDPRANVSLLSGDIGAPGVREDNSYHIVTCSGVTATLDGFTIAHAYSSLYEMSLRGGGLFILEGDVTVRRCTFRDNAAYSGAGMGVVSSSPKVVGCTFHGNEAQWGGAIYTDFSSPFIVNSLFVGNSAVRFGGAIVNAGVVVNSVFSGNTAGEDGGAIYYGAQVANCTFSRNAAGRQGGAIFFLDWAPSTLTNSILWENGESELYPACGPTTLSRCIARKQYPCMQTMEADPQFVDADGADNITGTLDDDLRLRPISPAIDAGDNAAVAADLADLDGDGNTSEPTPLDLGGHARRFDAANPDTGLGTPPVVDIGAYELVLSGLYLSKAAQPAACVLPGQWLTYTLSFGNNNTQAAANVVITDLVPAPLLDLRFRTSGVAMTPVPGASYAWRIASLGPDQAGTISIAGRVNPAITSRTWLANTALIGSATADPDPSDNRATVRLVIGGIIYVNAAAPAGGDGTSWAAAFNDLTAALAAAYPGEELWVAAGTYKPAANDWEASFALKSGVAVYGGFRGVETARAQRNWRANMTLLSGEIGEPGDPYDNSSHVVTARQVDATAILDGFHIAHGGGLWIYQASPIIANCVLRDNLAMSGGGVAIYGGSPLIVNCRLAGNVASSWGGGIYVYENSAPQVVNCVFTGNSARRQGGGVFAEAPSAPVVINCTFVGNAAPEGGGYYFIAHGAVVINSLFWGNRGGQLVPRYNDQDPQISYCLVQGGIAGDHNISGEPRFLDADGPDNIAGTYDDDLRPHPLSSVVDAGHNAALPADLADLDGDGNRSEPTSWDVGRSARLFDVQVKPDTGAGGPPVVDIGAFEGGQTGLYVHKIAIPAPGVRPGDPLEIVIAFGNNSGQSFSDITITDLIPAVLVERSLSYEGVVAAPVAGTAYSWRVAELGPHQQGVIRIRGRISPAVAQRLHLIDPATISAPAPDLDGNDNRSAVDTVVAGVMYVDADAPAGGDGSSWATAFRDLQDALGDAVAYDEIWVAAGTYRPTTTADREASFPLVVQVALYGGFRGGETSREQRDWRLNPTILSGEIGVQGGLGDNVYHVVTASPSSLPARLDGFRITGSYANGSYPRGNGGGLYVAQGNTLVVNCAFVDNSSLHNGGAVSRYGGTLRVVNTVFIDNESNSGGAIYSDPQDSGLSLANCAFIGNRASSGGALYSSWGAPEVANCTFANNTANAGGAIVTGYGNIIIRNSLFWGNSDQAILGSAQVSYSLVQGGYAGAGNLSADPRFFGLAGRDGAPGTADDDPRLHPDSPAIDAGSNALIAADLADLDGDGDLAEPVPYDLWGQARRVDVPGRPDAGAGAPPLVDMGACEAVFWASALPLLQR